MLERRSYRGESVDVFSMGVILFIMVTGTLPFMKEANIKDNLYQHIKSKKPDLFWQTWRQYCQLQKASIEEEER